MSWFEKLFIFNFPYGNWLPRAETSQRNHQMWYSISRVAAEKKRLCQWGQDCPPFWRMFNIVQLLYGGTKSRFSPQKYVYIYIYTSSTAQGGGGSFKDRKPIGEVGCCESWMAERIHSWTERWLECVFFGVVGMVAMVTSPTTAGCSVV